VEAALGASIRSAAPVGGGCISRTARVETAGGDIAFLKWGGRGEAPPGLFAAEARGLRALHDAGAVRVPAVLAVHDDGPPDGGSQPAVRDAVEDEAGYATRCAWLLLEWLEPGRPTDGGWERLGAALAGLHRHRAGRFGGDADNFIGALPQENAPLADWAAFWRDRRLAPQLRRAAELGLLDRAARAAFDRLLDRLPDHLAPAAGDGASLLHGDLWNGNVQHLRDGSAALIDPSVYHGHREVDLAMADLFGGFGAGFHAAYREAWPLADGYERIRRPSYQLYYLLVHVNLFGAGYVPATLAALRAVS
jgi:protein-ribulosamine 3-kinase